MLNELKLWLRALRAPFFQAVIVPCALGTAIAWYHTGVFHLGYFLLALIGAILINAGTNLSNDYFDHRTRADDINEGFTPFSGGSRVIQEGLISPRKMHVVALASFGMATVIGLYLVYARGWPLLIIGIVGILSGYLYTASPTRLVYRGWGEFVTALNCGPLVALGAYYVQAHRFSLEVIVASIPIGLLIAAILYINQFSDYEPDKAAGKKTAIVKLGPERAVKGYYLLLIGVYAIIVVASAIGIMPRLSLISLLSLPLAWRAATTLRVSYADGKKMIPAMASNVATHLTVGLLLCCSYMVSKIMHWGI